MPYKTIDLCAGIGGIRKGFELAGDFINVLSAETDKFACMTYECLFGENPHNDITTKEFKQLVANTDYNVLLSGFPCQTFSRAGKKEGFNNETKGIIFFHISDIIQETRPDAIFLENVDHLITHEKGATFNEIINILENELNYKIIGTTRDESGEVIYNARDFIRNSRDFGVPQNRPRTYIMGFNREKFGDTVNLLPNTLPAYRKTPLYNSLIDVLEINADIKYYMSSGYLQTLIKHKARQKEKGNGYGYCIVNKPELKKPIANTLLATGGSGKERNLIYDPQEGIAGIKVANKRTPLNEKSIRVMTPNEWGKLQGFINYAFLDKNGNDHFRFPSCITDAQKYKQFGNSVTIPTIEEMASFLNKCLTFLDNIR